MPNSPLEGDQVKLDKSFILILQLYSMSLCFFPTPFYFIVAKNRVLCGMELVEETHGKPGIENGMEEKPERRKQL